MKLVLYMAALCAELRPKSFDPVLLRLGLAAGAVFAIASSSAFAGDTYFKDRFELEVNASASTTESFYADAALTYSFTAPYYESGFKFRLGTSDSRYRYSADGAAPTLARDEDISLDFMFGGGLQLGNWYVMGLAGPSLIWSRQSLKEDTTATTALKLLASVSGNPTEHTMLFVQGSYLTVLDAYFLQGKYGFETLQKMFVGPEVVLTGRMHLAQAVTNYDELRVGAFISGITLGPVLIGGSVGFLHDRDQRNGAYVGTSARIAF
jgi:cellulose biosynthesis protein BcsS